MPVTGHPDTDQTADGPDLRRAITNALSFLAQTDDMQQGFPTALAILANGYGCSRAFVFHFDSEQPDAVHNFYIASGNHPGLACDSATAPNTPMDNGQPWCSISRTPAKIANWLNHLRARQPLIIRDTAQMDPAAKNEQQFLVASGIKALLLLPMVQHDTLVGLLGLGDRVTPRRWPAEELHLLQGMAFTLGSFLTGEYAYESLLSKRKRYREMLDNIEDGYFEVDLSGRITLWNQSLRRILNRPEANLEGLHFRNFFVRADVERLYKAFNRVLADGRPAWGIEWSLVTGDGERRYVEASASVISQTNGTAAGFRGFVRDITSRKLAEETIRHLAFHDGLTGLPNRMSFQQHLRRAIQQTHRGDGGLAVLFLDLDQFKMINDALGHSAGDDCLREVAGRLQHCLRTGDLVARFGGDEFVILLHDTATREQVIHVVRRITSSFERPWTYRGHEFYLTVSVGIAMFPGDGVDGEVLLSAADTAMYQAKEDNYCSSYRFCTPAQTTAAYEQMLQESRLRQAIRQDGLVLHYQPKLQIGTGAIVGLEALVRWQDPLRGLIFPGDFIELAERTGLIVELGDRVLQQAAQQARTLLDAGMAPLRMGVNLSALEVYRGGIADKVRYVLKEYDLDPRWLEFELTERAALQDVTAASQILSELVQMGVGLALDDFGAGHCSLSYLRYFPFHTLKIDKSFVAEVTRDPHAAAITRAVAVMGRSLGLTVLAEGVETEEQLIFLKHIGCHQMQGFLFSKPVPPEQLKSLLQRPPQPLIPPLPSSDSPRFFAP